MCPSIKRVAPTKSTNGPSAEHDDDIEKEKGTMRVGEYGVEAPSMMTRWRSEIM